MKRRSLMLIIPSSKRFFLIALTGVIFALSMITFAVSAWVIHRDTPSSRLYRSTTRIASSSSSSSSSSSNNNNSREGRRKIIPPLQLYQKGEGISYEHEQQNRLLSSSPAGFKKDNRHSNLFLNTTTRLLSMSNKNNDGTATCVVQKNRTLPVPITTKVTTIIPVQMYDIPLSSPPTSLSSSTSIQSGTFGDIMSQPNNDADFLFRDGLVTSETYSLEDIYGITNPLDRMAVTANGNLQRLFSSYYDAPVVVEMVHCTRQQQQQQQQKDDHSIHAVWDRRVLLKIFNQTICTADSVVVVHSKEVEDLVESGKVGIGQIFRHFNTLPEFNLLTVGPTKNGGFWRYYTLESDLVTCSIREIFCNGVWNISPSSNENEKQKKRVIK